MRIVSMRSASVVAAVLLTMLGSARAESVRVLDAPFLEAGAQFGSALAAVGDMLAVGAPGTRELGKDGAGAVHVFDADGTLRRTLIATNPVAGAGLGAAMAASDTRLYVGAPGDRPLGIGGLGAVYVFDVTGALIRQIRAPDPDASTMPVGGAPVRFPAPSSTFPPPVAAGFGRALAVDGARLVVGAPESLVDGETGAGAVYVLDASDRVLRTLREFPGRAGASLGAAVALSGDLVFVGAPGAPSPGDVAGAGRVLVFDARTGALLRHLDVPLATEGAALGASIRVIGDAVFVGAPGARVLGIAGAGAVYVFDTATRVLRRTITPPTPAVGAGFGFSLGLIEQDPLVGAPGADVVGVEGAGMVFRLRDSNVASFIPTRPRRDGGFGVAVATFGSSVAIGEPAPDTGVAGRVYLFAATVPSSGGPSPLRSTAGTGGTIAAGCPRAATLDSIDCRLGELLSSLTAHEANLTRPLRRAIRGLHRGRGVPALLEGQRQMEIFVRRLARPRAWREASLETRAAAADAARAIGGDLGDLAR